MAQKDNNWPISIFTPSLLISVLGTAFGVVDSHTTIITSHPNIIVLYIYLGSQAMAILLVLASFVYSLFLKNGFLISLNKFFINLVIILIIVAIGMPNVLRFEARSKQSEAKQNLIAIYTAYQSYYDDYGTYPTSQSIVIGDQTYNCFTVAKWEPTGSLRYNYECMGKVFFWREGRDVDKNHPLQSCPTARSQATKDSFTIAACGNIDNDTTLDEWTIDDAKHLRNVVDDVKN